MTNNKVKSATTIKICHFLERAEQRSTYQTVSHSTHVTPTEILVFE